MQTYLVVIEKADGNYSAYSPDVPGCITTGSTVEDTLANMREALATHLDLLAAEGDALPEARGLEYHWRVDAELHRSMDVLFAHVAIELPASGAAVVA